MKKGKPGQPQDDVRLEGFLKVVQYLRENDDEQVTIGDLVDKMEDYLAEEKENGAYTPEHMKKNCKSTLVSKSSYPLFAAKRMWLPCTPLQKPSCTTLMGVASRKMTQNQKRLITLTTTLDGKDTFHGMGILATVTPGTSQDRCVPRREVKREEILTAGKIEIKPPFENQQHQLQVMYKDMIVKTVEGPAKSLDILWKSSLLFDNTRPAWPGMMQAILSG
eukprot:gene2793-3232_t